MPSGPAWTQDHPLPPASRLHSIVSSAVPSPSLPVCPASRAPGLGPRWNLDPPAGSEPRILREVGTGVGGCRECGSSVPARTLGGPRAVFVSAESWSHGASGTGCSGRHARPDAPTLGPTPPRPAPPRRLSRSPEPCSPLEPPGPLPSGACLYGLSSSRSATAEPSLAFAPRTGVPKSSNFLESACLPYSRQHQVSKIRRLPP